jgi:hypothetical protein
LVDLLYFNSCGIEPRHGDLASVADAPNLIERERGRQVAERVDLRLQIGDLLFRGCNGIGVGDKAARRRLLARNDDERSRELGQITGLPTILNQIFGS